MSLTSYLLLDLHPLIVTSCEELSITPLVGSSELGGTGGKRTLRPNKCFFFFISFPDMNLAETGGGEGVMTGRNGAERYKKYTESQYKNKEDMKTQEGYENR